MNTKISHHIYGWLLVMPAVILMGTFTHLPSVTTLISSFFSNETKKRPSIFIGAENYEYMFEDPVFVEAVMNNLWYSLGTIIPSIILAIIMALFVNSKLPGKTLLRMAYFTPTILPMIAVSNLWLFFYTPDIGLLDQIGALFGLVRRYEYCLSMYHRHYNLERGRFFYDFLFSSTAKHFSGFERGCCLGGFFEIIFL